MKGFWLALGSFMLGAALTGAWLHYVRISPVPLERETEAGGPVLSEKTRTVLARLRSPVELRFYCLLDPTTVSDSMKSFAQRADGWVSAYEREAGGRIKVTRYTTPSYPTANAAVKDGILPLNADKGEASFLGVVWILKDQKEALAQLNPEWESALESDLTRALARLLDATRPGPPPGPVAQVYTNATQEVQALIPDPAAVSLEQGTRLLREAALKEFQAAVRQGEAQVKEAQQKLIEAQNGKSPAEAEAARKNLLQVQAEQMERLKELAAKSQAQVEAFQRLKSGTP